MDTMPVNQKLFLGRETLYVDESDYVSRFWLLTRSKSGAYNATFEGIRCGNQEYIVYAYGQPSRMPNVRRVATPKWRDIGPDYRFNYRRELAMDYICAGVTPKTPEQVEQSVKGLYKKHNPYSEYTDF